MLQGPGVASGPGSLRLMAGGSVVHRGGLTLRLPGGPQSVRMARAFVRGAADGSNVAPDVLDDVLLLTSEVVTNAVLHGGGCAELRVVISAETVRVEVDDASPEVPTERRYGADATTGRGLGLIAALASSWGVAPQTAGKTVWFEVGGASADESQAASGDSDLLPRPIAVLGVPVRLYVATQQHNDELLKEFAFIAGDGESSEDGQTRLVTLAQMVRETFAAPAAESRAQVEAAVARGDEFVDLVLAVPPAAAPFAEQLYEHIEEAEQYSESGKLLTLASTPEVRRFRRWFLEQCLLQLKGGAPTPWPG